MSTTRLYVVADTQGKAVALIEAPNAAQAARHFLSKNYTVKYAEQLDVLKAVESGLAMQKAGEE